MYNIQNRYIVERQLNYNIRPEKISLVDYNIKKKTSDKIISVADKYIPTAKYVYLPLLIVQSLFYYASSGLFSLGTQVLLNTYY